MNKLNKRIDQPKKKFIKAVEKANKIVRKKKDFARKMTSLAIWVMKMKKEGKPVEEVKKVFYKEFWKETGDKHLTLIINMLETVQKKAKEGGKETTL